MKRAIAWAVPVLLGIALSGCANRSVTREPAFQSVPDPASVRHFDPPPASVEGSLIGLADPFEQFNRKVYTFNARFDRAVFLPAVRTYHWLLPEFVEHRVSDFFANLYEVRNFVNNALQLRGKDAGVTAARFLINTTIGIGGLFDPAERLNLLARKEDFGQTLGFWGVGAGPYLVLPLLGPSGLRDAGGLSVDFAYQSLIDPLSIDDLASSSGVNLLNALDTRANTSFRYYETGSPFEYVLVRYAYTRMREIEISR